MIDYEGRRFRAVDGDSAAIAAYHQDGDVVWADVSGGDVRHGAVAGVRTADGSLHMGYVIVLATGEVVCGRTVNTPEIVAGDRIRLREVWQRYGTGAASGVSYIEEVKPGAPGN